MTTDNHVSEQTIAEDSMALSSGVAAFEGKHFARAQQLLFPLAQLGHPEAQYRMAIMCQNGLGMVAQVEQAFFWMKKAAEQGLDLAQHGLGFMYMQGEGVTRDDAQAVNWFRTAAEQGLAGAQIALATMYEEGRGVEKDVETAKYWYAKAGF